MVAFKVSSGVAAPLTGRRTVIRRSHTVTGLPCIVLLGSSHTLSVLTHHVVLSRWESYAQIPHGQGARTVGAEPLIKKWPGFLRLSILETLPIR